jgi:ribosomal protein L11 methyltransferase
MTFLATTIVTEAAARTLADAAEDDAHLGGRSVAIEELGTDRWRIVVYFDAEPDPDDVAALARLLTAAEADAVPFVIEKLPDADWVAKSLEGLPPVRAGRFLIHGSHDRARVGANDLGIEIEAGLAFGTGHHGTTAACLLAIDQLAKSRPIRRALDVGTGSGVLAIAIARRAPAARIVASDIDPVAVVVARANMRLNGTGARIVTAIGPGLGLAAIRRNAPYDLIVANILAGPLVALAPAIRRNLAPGGMVILSGLLTEQRRRVAAAYRSVGMRAVRTITIGEWATLVLSAAVRSPRPPYSAGARARS